MAIKKTIVDFLTELWSKNRQLFISQKQHIRKTVACVQKNSSR